MHRIKYGSLGRLLLLLLVLGCRGEYAAILDGVSGKTVQMLPYRVASFSPADQAALRRGIVLEDPGELPGILEDFFS